MRDAKEYITHEVKFMAHRLRHGFIDSLWLFKLIHVMLTLDSEPGTGNFWEPPDEGGQRD